MVIGMVSGATLLLALLDGAGLAAGGSPGPPQPAARTRTAARTHPCARRTVPPPLVGIQDARRSAPARTSDAGPTPRCGQPHRSSTTSAAEGTQLGPKRSTRTSPAG